VINYMLNQWHALVHYCEDGTVEIDNNIAENALRRCYLGRKKLLFIRADSGGERAAAMYSLIGSARHNRIDAQFYLRYVLSHIADHPVNRDDELFPGTWLIDLHLFRADRTVVTCKVRPDVLYLLPHLPFNKSTKWLLCILFLRASNRLFGVGLPWMGRLPYAASTM